jgi:hypothetical protein
MLGGLWHGATLTWFQHRPITQAMGDWWDHAVAESFLASLKPNLAPAMGGSRARDETTG